MCQQRLKQRMRPLPFWRVDKEKCELHAKKSCITFGNVDVREYSRELGAFSDLDYGLSIGWDYEQCPETSVDQYEQERRRNIRSTPFSSSSPNGDAKRNASKVAMTTSNRRRVGVTGASAASDKKKKTSKSNIHLKPSTTCERKKILTTFGFSKQEIQKAEAECRLQGRKFTAKLRIIVRRSMQEVF